jgi:NAD(P)-dependent dehydrogenase (short-subunit alcohol dehydrogenase family)
MSVEGWIVVVTGASSGNGKAISLALASKGARVVLAARRARLLEAVAREAKDLGGEALVVPCDVTVPEQVQNVARAAVERWGRIDRATRSWATSRASFSSLLEKS